MSKPPKTASKAQLAAALGSPQPSTLPALPQYAPQDVAFRAPAIPPVPHSTRLLIVRAPGGYTLFASDYVAWTSCDSSPDKAVAVASTPADLAARIRDWTNAKPEPSVDANI